MNLPVYTIHDRAIELVAQIAEKVGVLKASNLDLPALNLRKASRVRSIHSSLAIEQNTLSLEQVSSVIDGKRVLGPPNQILEVQNAFNAYEQILKVDAYSVEDFLATHKLMTSGLIQESGKFRSQGVGVFDEKRLIHIGANYQFVPQLVEDLFAWARDSQLHMLIKSCIVHFELEFIHPFMDGNGRMGRLWQSVMLSRWHELFAWLPIENIVLKNQQIYYDSLEATQKKGDSGDFIDFMLGVILETLNSLNEVKITDIFTDMNTDILSGAEYKFLGKIVGFLSRNGSITNAQAVLISGRKTESVKKQLRRLTELGFLKAEGTNKGRKYLIAVKGK